MSILYRGPSKDASYQVSIHLAMWFQSRRFLKNQPINVVAMFVNGSGRNEVSEEKIFKNRPIRNKNCLWRSCLLMDRDKMINL